MNNIIAPIVAPSEMGSLAALAWGWIAAFAPRLVGAVLILVVGLLLARWTDRGFGDLLGRLPRVDPTLRPVARAIVRYGIFIVMLVLLLNQLGIETTTLVTVLGAAGLAIGLALQGTLSNIAAGIMLLWLRPFTIGDYVEVASQPGLVGFVEDTGLFNCTLRTYDGARVFAPNSTLWNTSLRNHSQAPSRMLAVSVTLAGDGSGPVVPALKAALEGDQRILPAPAPEIFVEQLTNTNIVLTCRFWAGHSAYGAVQRSIVDLLRNRLLAAGVPSGDIQLIARITPGPSDPSRLMGAG